MRHPRFLPTLLSTLTAFAAGAAAAQARPVLGVRSLEIALERALDRALTPLAEGNPAAARRQLDRLLDASPAVDLAPLRCARALQLGLAGEREQAAMALDLHFARHPGGLPLQPAWVGQIYLDALREQVSHREVDGQLVQQLALRALALRQSPTAVAAVLGSALDAQVSGTTADAIRGAVAARIREDATVAAPERVVALRTLDGELPPPEEPATPAPLTLVLHTVSGKRIDLASLRGRVVLLHFWSTWCPVSAAEAPTLATAFARFHTRGLEVIGIAAEDDSESAPVRAAAVRMGLAWEHVLDGDALSGPLATRLGVEALPYAILIDRHGVVRRSGDALRGELLAPAIEALLEGSLPARREGDGHEHRR